MAGPVFAAEGSARVSTSNGHFVLYIDGSASLADDGIDTTEVMLPCNIFFSIDPAGAASLLGTEAFLGNLEAVAADSLAIGIDVGVPGVWYEDFSVANDGSNLDKLEAKPIIINQAGPWLRFRVQNVSGAALTSNIVFSAPIISR
jgi:hypothetical protein